MTSVSEFVLNYVVNASWQMASIVIVAAAAAYVLRNGPARHRHALWFATLALCVAVPLLSATHTPLLDATHSSSPEKSVFTSSAETPVTASAPVSHEPDLSLSRLTTRRARVVNASSSTALWLTLAYGLILAWRVITLGRFWVKKERLRRLADHADFAPGVA